MRRIRKGWLPPSLLSRVLNVVTWTARLTRWSHVRRLEVERVRFDTQLLQNPATRYKLVEALRIFRLPIGTWTGGRTRWNRGRFGIEKTHALDALCVGELAGVWVGKHKPLTITAMGRGDHCRTLWTDKGFPRGYKMRQKMVAGFATGDRVKANVPAQYKTAGTHVGRVLVRKSRSFTVTTRERKVDGINAMYCRIVQRGDGYHYTSV